MKMMRGLVCLAVLLVPMLVSAQSTCPADRAGQQGFSPFEAFHHIMAPAWHQAWPEKDYAALLAVGPQFEESFVAIAALKPEFTNESRREQFTVNRGEFGTLVKKYADAAKAGDKETVYALMPNLHDAFEQTASALLPVHYPQFEGMVLTVNMILETHLPADNTEGIIGSTETLVTKLDALTEATLPEELRGQEKDIVVSFDAMRTVAAKMKMCCDKNDMDGYREYVTALDGQIRTFIKKYI